MPSSFSTNLHLELQATGENSGTWGALLNSNDFTILDNVLGGVQTLSLSSTDVTVNTTQSQNNLIKLTGTLTANVSVIFPAIGRTYVVQNSTTGAFTVTLKIGASTGTAIAQGTTGIYVLDASDVAPLSSVGTFIYAAAAGTNTITASFTPALTAYGTGSPLMALKILNTNTGSVTFNLNSLGAKTGKTTAGANLVAGQLVAGMIALISYDGTNIQVLNPAPVNYRYIGYQQFTSSGTYTPSAACVYHEVEGVAPGGGGGSGQAQNSNGTSASGGGGGAGAWGFYSSASPTTTTITIGAAGTGSTNTASSGGTGGNASFGSLLVLAGGLGGNSISNAVTGYRQGQGGDGGAPSAGTRTTKGQPGDAGAFGGYSGIGSTPFTVTGGSGGVSPYGGGGLGGYVQPAGTAVSQNGGNAGGYGAGGGGGASGVGNTAGSPSVANGGNGSGGLIIVKEYALA